MKKFITFAMLLALCLVSACGKSDGTVDSTGNTAGELQKQASQEDTTVAPVEIHLNNPVIEADSEYDAGQKVTWDCIYYGTYPQTEIVSKNEDSGTYEEDGEYFIWDKEIIHLYVDGSLYDQLSKSDQWDSNNEMEIDHVRYKRMSRQDAVLAYDRSNYFYHWDNDYHYFRFDPVKWRVLDVGDDRILLLSDVILDVNEPDFDLEQLENNIFTDTDKKSFYDPSIGLFLLDRSYLVSEKGESYGFLKDPDSDDEGKKSIASTYAHARGAVVETHSNRMDHTEWLVADEVNTRVACAGSIYTYDYGEDEHADGIRPAVYINKTSLNWTYGGRVTSGSLPIYDESSAPDSANGENPDANVSDEASLPAFDQLTYGDICTFGSFHQSEQDGKAQPLEWIVCGVNGNTLRLIS